MMRPFMLQRVVGGARKIIGNTTRDITPATAPSLAPSRSRIFRQTLAGLKSINTRCYATAASETSHPKKATKPKSTTKKPARKSAAKPKAKKPAAKKKKAAPKKKKKALVKPKRKAPTEKKPLTELQSKRAQVLKLRNDAMLDQPKLLPSNAWTLFLAEHISKGSKADGQVKEISRAYKALSSSETSQYSATAASNLESNQKTMSDWLGSFTAAKIQSANNARRQLNRIAKEPKPAGAQYALVSHPYQMLPNARKVKQPLAAYSAFTKRRWASGDFKNVSIIDAARSLSQEWKTLDASEKQSYIDSAKRDVTRYREEYTRVNGVAPGPKKKQA